MLASLLNERVRAFSEKSEAGFELVIRPASRRKKKSAWKAETGRGAEESRRCSGCPRRGPAGTYAGPGE
jgi:hypothetical protein